MLALRTEVTDLSMVGVYDYHIRACITFASDGSQICDRSTDLQITIENPCLETNPDTSPIEDISVGQLASTGITLSGWPFSNSVDSTIDDLYGTNLCGGVELALYDSTDTPVDWIVFNEDDFSMQLDPDLNM